MPRAESLAEFPAPGKGPQGGPNVSRDWIARDPRKPPNEWRISCEGARGSRRATSQQYKARRLPQIERALVCCMRWLGGPARERCGCH